MTKNKKLTYVWRIIFYLLGLVILAAGITLNTKTDLGVSPIISPAFCVSQLVGTNLGNATFVWYSIFVVIEVIIHALRKKFRLIPADLLQILISLIFTRFMNIYSALIPNLGQDMAGTIWGSMVSRIIFLLIAIILTGVGAAMSLNARLIPNPGDGVVQTISDAVGKSVGFVKNCVDISCVCLALIIGFAAGYPVLGAVVGVGTVLAMIGIGRVIAVFNHFVMKPMSRLMGL